MDYIGDDGTCGNLNTGESRDGCVEALLQEAGASATTTGGVAASGTASGVKATSTIDTSGTPTTGGINGVVASESQNGASGVMLSSLLPLGVVAIMLAV